MFLSPLALLGIGLLALPCSFMRLPEGMLGASIFLVLSSFVKPKISDCAPGEYRILFFSSFV